MVGLFSFAQLHANSRSCGGTRLELFCMSVVPQVSLADMLGISHRAAILVLSCIGNATEFGRA
eukprot:14419102-Alexandrium_andersonii.AAC.1